METPTAVAAEGMAVQIRLRSALLALAWLLAVALSLAWNLSGSGRETLKAAHSRAVLALSKDLLSQRWSIGHRGQTPSGRSLPFMDGKGLGKQLFTVQEAAELDVHSHPTSLKPSRPENSPDAWEREALEGFSRGATEASGVAMVEGKPFFRLIRKLRVEKTCLSCHADDRENDIRGGISVSIPMAPLLAEQARHDRLLCGTHAVLSLVGLALLGLGYQRLERIEAARAAAERGREKTISDLQAALGEVKTLSGMLPICANCKKIRDDRGYWNQLETYIGKRSRATFSHGICPECSAKLYPELPDHDKPA
ncbi:MAG: DUF3365 domain-containing protein [Elusimicrobia bacterium]|nr:DUF3365 domain-containing protein [Elusimicrobiota bacterium]